MIYIWLTFDWLTFFVFWDASARQIYARTYVGSTLIAVLKRLIALRDKAKGLCLEKRLNDFKGIIFGEFTFVSVCLNFSHNPEVFTLSVYAFVCYPSFLLIMSISRFPSGCWNSYVLINRNVYFWSLLLLLS